MFAIFGSGFGLYGYLPALVGCGHSVVLPERYRPRYQARVELARFAADIKWVADENAALDRAIGAALVGRPIDQEMWLAQCLSKPGLKYLLLEKPLARTPELAQFSLDALNRSDKTFRIGYLFRLTNWGRQLIGIFEENQRRGKLQIHWHFCAHHYRHDLENWKRFVSMGGGAIRFFGIHVIALLAQIGYQDVVISKTFGTSVDEAELWTASFTGRNLPECEVIIDTRSPDTMFDVVCTKGADSQPDVSLHCAGPFDSDRPPEADMLSGLDPRTSILKTFCSTLWDESDADLEWYQRTLDLWRTVEDKSCFELLDSNTLRPVFAPLTSVERSKS